MSIGEIEQQKHVRFKNTCASEEKSDSFFSTCIWERASSIKKQELFLGSFLVQHFRKCTTKIFCIIKSANINEKKNILKTIYLFGSSFCLSISYHTDLFWGFWVTNTLDSFGKYLHRKLTVLNCHFQMFHNKFTLKTLFIFIF